MLNIFRRREEEEIEYYVTLHSIKIIIIETATDEE
jgi:hypothetical protein